MHDCIRKTIKLLNDYLINCKSFQKHHSITKWLPNNYPPVIVMHDSLRTRTDRPDLPILKKAVTCLTRSYFLCWIQVWLYFIYIVAVSFIDWWNQNTQRKSPTCHISLTTLEFFFFNYSNLNSMMPATTGYLRVSTT